VLLISVLEHKLFKKMEHVSNAQKIKLQISQDKSANQFLQDLLRDQEHQPLMPLSSNQAIVTNHGKSL